MKKKIIPESLTSAVSNATEEPEELFPLSGPGIGWYKAKGRNAVTNISRSKEIFDISFDNEDEGTTQVVLSSISGTIKENLESLLKKLSDARSTKQQEHLEAMIILEYVIENGPIIATQELARRYKEVKGIVAKRVWGLYDMEVK